MRFIRSALSPNSIFLTKMNFKKSYVIDSKKFSLSKLKYAVQRMEGLSFVDGKNSLSGKDILGDFFEGIIRNGFKQSKGQFFTHSTLSDLCFTPCRLISWQLNESRKIKNFLT